MIGYDHSISIIIILQKFTMLFIYFSASTSIAGLIVYIVNLEEKRYNLQAANSQLLDGMHEGILILSKETKDALSPMFCNKTAQKLI